MLQLTRPSLAQAARKVLVSLAVFAAPVGSYLLWRVITFGRWLPNTAIAKAQHLPGLDALAKPNALSGYVGWLGVTVVAGIIVLRSPSAAPASPTAHGEHWPCYC